VASFIIIISLKLMPVLLLVTFLLWNCITDFELKHDFTKLIFKVTTSTASLLRFV